MNNYLLVHGSFGSPFVNWFPYLRNEIEKKGLVVYTPDFPTGVGYQNYNNWEKVLECYLDCGLINENTIIYAHSIGPIFVCKFLVKHKIKVKKLVFVCGFNNYLGINEEYDNGNKTMDFDDLEEVKELAEEIVCFYSKNDPYVKYDTEKEFANTIATKEIIIDDGEHLNSESGYTEFKELLEFI